MFSRSLTVGIALALAAATARGAESPLTKKQSQVLAEGVVPAYKQGDALTLLKLLSPLAGELSETRLAAADELLAGHEVPAVADLLGQSRLALVIQGAGPLPPPKPREAALTAQGIKSVLERTLAEKVKHKAFADPLAKPATLEEYRQLFWTIHVLENQLQTAYDVARYAAGLTKAVPERQQATLSEEQRAALATNWQELAGQITAAQRELEEREAELRIQRIEAAVARLEEQGFTKERLLAAAALEEDGRLVAEFLTQNDPAKTGRAFVREALNAPSLAGSIKDQVARGRKAGGDVAAKGQLLFAGLHWWMRGRYGRGPEGWGLLKSAWATRSPQAYFSLYMPRETPQPTDPFQSGRPSPDYERRHHYTWNFEPRSVQSVETSRKTQTVVHDQRQFTLTFDFFY